ncbi:hypothetical protein ACLOJK_008235 [Asimina triloba]
MDYQQLITLSLPVFLPLLIYLILHGFGFSLNKKAHHLRLPPSPPKLPIIGHLHLLSSDMPHLALSKLSARLGPIVHLQLGQIPTLVISSPRLARDVLKTHDHAFASRPQLIAAQYLSFRCSDVTFSPYGAYWRQARKICVTELLSPRRVNSFTLIRHQEVTRLLQSLPAAAQVDMSERFFALANDVLCRVAFGRRFAEAARGLNLNEVLAETQALLAGFSVGDFFPGLEWVNKVTGLKGRLERNLRDLRTVCDEIIKEHVSANGGDDDGSEMREDFVDVLLRVQKSSDLEVPITDDNLKALVLGLFAMYLYWDATRGALPVKRCHRSLLAEFFAERSVSSR